MSTNQIGYRETNRTDKSRIETNICRFNMKRFSRLYMKKKKLSVMIKAFLELSECTNKKSLGETEAERSI